MNSREQGRGLIQKGTSKIAETDTACNNVFDLTMEGFHEFAT